MPYMLPQWLNRILARNRSIGAPKRPTVMELLEQRQMLSAVVGRHLFYNNSAFDGRTPGADVRDDSAIAIDKVALLKDQATTFANYSSYSLGINGVMVDVAGLAPGAVLTAADFEFFVGNKAEGGFWAQAPAPLAVTVRPGAGAGGSDRVSILWADGAIKKQWLQVTVLATANTGLAEPDVFYFGSAVGETGNDPNGTRVNGTDEILARFNPRTLLNPAPITDPYDFNRDRKVDATDQVIARNNGTNLQTDLLRLTPALTAAGTPRVQRLSPTVARLSWFDMALEERAYVIEASLAGGPFVALAPAPRNATAAIVSGLAPGGHYTFRITAQGPAGSTASATVPAAMADGPDESGWYRITLQSPMQDGEKTYTGTELVPFAAPTGWVWSSSWRQAVYDHVAGKAKITNPTGVTYDFAHADAPGMPYFGAFKVDTVEGLAATSNLFDLRSAPWGLSNAQQVIVLEDTWNSTNIDQDFDDFFWKIQVQKLDGTALEATPWLPVNHSHDELNAGAGGAPRPDNAPDLADGHGILETDPDLRDATLFLPQVAGKWKLQFPGDVMVWRKVGAAAYEQVTADQEYDLVPGIEPIRLKLEGMFESDVRDKVTLRAFFTPATGTPSQAQVQLTVVAPDLDVDSDNDDRYEFPDFSDREERLEADATHAGKIVYSQATQRAKLSLFYLGPSADIADARFDLTYSSAGLPGSGGTGHLRIWKSATGTAAGDFLAPGVYTGSQLGLSATNHHLTLYVQGVVATALNDLAARTISVKLDPDGAAAAAGYEAADSVLVSVDTGPVPGFLSGYKWNDLNNNGVRDADLVLTPPNNVWIVDVSGSTMSQFVGIDPVGYVNNDNTPGTILDGQLQAYINLSRHLVDEGYGNTKVAVVVFGSTAKALDLDPATPGDQYLISPGPALEAELVKITKGYQGVGESTNYEAALDEAIRSARRMIALPQKVNVFFLSDGYPAPDERPSRYTDEVAILRGVEFRDAGGNSRLNLRAFGAGQGSSLDHLWFIDQAAQKFVTSDPLVVAFDGSVEEAGVFNEPGLAGWEITAFVDGNNNGALDPGETSYTTQTGVDGTYALSLPVGTYVVRETMQPGWSQTFPGGSQTHTITVTSNGEYEKHFGNHFVGQPNLIIDSDNTNGYNPPDRSAIEDQLEDRQGKDVFVNDTDPDGDGKPGWVDFESPGTSFTPMVIELSAISSLDLSSATIRFSYNGSDPTKLGNGGTTPAPGLMRVWRKDAGELRSASSDYVKPDTDYPLSYFGFDGSSDTDAVLYVEGLTPAPLFDSLIRMDVDADGSGPGRFQLMDSVYVKILPLAPGSGIIKGHVFRDRNRNTQWDEQLLLGDRPDVIMVIDASQSTVESVMSGSSTTAIGDINNDDKMGADTTTVLDAQIAGFIALNQQLIDLEFGSTANVAVVPYATQAWALDLRPDLPGQQFSTTPAADLDRDGEYDVVQALKGLLTDGGADTQPELGLEKARDLLDEWGTTAENANVFLLSDGYYDGTLVTGISTELRNRGINLRAYAVGAISSIAQLREVDPQASRLLSADDILGALAGLGGGTTPEEGLGGWTVWADVANFGTIDPGEVTAVSQPDGSYTLANVPTGNVQVRMVMKTPPPPWLQTAPKIYPETGEGEPQSGDPEFFYRVLLGDGQTVAKLNFGVVEDLPPPTADYVVIDDPDLNVDEASPVIVRIESPAAAGPQQLPLLYSFDLNNDGDFIDRGESYRSVSTFTSMTVDDGPAMIDSHSVRIRIHDAIGNVADFTNIDEAFVLNVPPSVLIRGLADRYDLGDFFFGGQAASVPALGVVLDPSEADAAAGYQYQWILSKGGVVLDDDVEGAIEPGQTNTVYHFTPTDGPGTYTLTLRALDKDGNPAVPGDWGQASKEIVVTNEVPVISAVNASPNPVTGTTTQLSVVATDDAGEPYLRYYWEVDRPEDVIPASFDAIGTNEASTLDVEFLAPGAYEFTVYAIDDEDNWDVGTVTVSVQATPTLLEMMPSDQVIVWAEETYEFNVRLTDQFGTEIPVLDENTTWSIITGTPLGTIDGTGLYTAGTGYGTETIRATVGSLSVTAEIVIPDPANAPMIGAASGYVVREGDVVGTPTYVAGQGIAGFLDSRTDTDPSEYSAVVDWDTSDAVAGVAAEVESFPLAGDFTAWEVWANHVYTAPGTYEFSVTLTHDDGAVRTKTVLGTVDVQPAGISYGFVIFNPIRNVEYDGPVFRFTSDDPTDTADQFTADITWGDGTQTLGVEADESTQLSGFFEIRGAHTYADADPATKIVKVTLYKNTVAFFPTGQEPTQPIQVVIPNSENFPIVGAGSGFGVGEGVTFGNSLVPGEGLAGFIDALPGTALSEYSAIVDWGDNTAPQAAQVISYLYPGTDVTVYEVFAPHAYADTGSFSATVTLRHNPTNRSQTAVASVDVLAGNVGYQLLVSNFVKGVEFDGPVLRFNSGDPTDTAGEFDVDILWGDGVSSPAPAVAALGGGIFEVSAAHVYDTVGLLTLTVSVDKNGAELFTLQAPVRVQSQSMTAPTIVGSFNPSPSQIGLEWTKIDGAEYVLWSYNKKTGVKRRIPQRLDEVVWWKDSEKPGIVWTVDSNLPIDTTFVYTVQAVYPDGSTSPESEPFQVSTPPDAQAPQPSNLTGAHTLADRQGNGMKEGVDLFWNPTDDIGGYRVFRKVNIGGTDYWLDLQIPATEPIAHRTTLAVANPDWEETLIESGDVHFSGGQVLVDNLLDPSFLNENGKVGWFDDFDFHDDFGAATTIEYAVVAYNLQGDPDPGVALISSPAAMITVPRDTQPPTRPTNVRAASFPEAVQLTWDDRPETPENADWAGWNVERLVGGVWVRLNDRLVTDEQGYNDFIAPVGEISRYRVYSVDKLGNASPPVEVACRRADHGEPPPPGGVVARSDGTGGGGVGNIRVEWDHPVIQRVHDDDALDGYDVERFDPSTGTWTLLRAATHANGGDDHLVDVGLPLQNSFTYRVRTVDLDGDYSPWVVVTAATGDGNRPATPTLVSKQALGESSIHIEWSGAAGLKYRIYRSSPTEGFAPITGDDTDEVELTDEGLASATSYAYRIYAVDADGDLSENPLEVSQATDAPDDPLPPVLHIKGFASNTPIVISADTKVFGVVDDPNNDLASWQLVLRRLNTSGADVVIAGSNPNETVAIKREVGQAPDLDKLLGTIQPTLLENGIYQLVLEASDGTHSPELIAGGLVQVKTDVKLGNFALPFEDMRIDVPGGDPIIVRRVYDSAMAGESGDFGFGWRLEVSDTRLRDTATPSKRYGSDPTIRMNDLVYVTVPGVGEHVFQFVPRPSTYEDGARWPLFAIDPTHIFYAGDSYTPQFISVDGSGATLRLADDQVSLRYDRDVKEFKGFDNDVSFHPAAEEFGGKYVLRTVDGAEYVVDASDGSLDTSTDANGNVTKYEDGYIQSQNKRLTIHREGGLIRWVSTDPTGDGPKISYEYDADGNLQYVTDPTGRRTQFVYDDARHDHFLTKMIDPNEVQVLKVTYDAGGKVVVVEDVRQNKSPLSYGGFNGSSGTTSSTDLEGNKVERIFNDRGAVVREIREVKDGQGNIVGYQINVHDYSYRIANSSDIADMVELGVTEINQLTAETQWHAFTIAYPDPTGRRYTVRPDDPSVGAKRARSVAYHVGDPTSPDNGKMASETLYALDGSERTTTFGDYFRGKPRIIQDPYGAVTSNGYDAVGNLVWTQNAVGERTYFSYTAGGNYAYADGTSVDYAGLPRGLLLETWQERPDGPDQGTEPDKVNVTKNVYYSRTETSERNWGRLKSGTDAAGQTTFYAYDDEGRTTHAWQQRTHATAGLVRVESETVYDDAGRVIRNVEGRVVSEASGAVVEAGTTSRMFYDANGQAHVAIDALGGKTISTYDARGHLIRTLNPDGTEIRTVYDNMGRELWTSDPFASTSSYTFNEATGVLTWDSTDNTSTYVVTHHLYDALGRPAGSEKYKAGKIELVADAAVGNGVLRASEPDRDVMTAGGQRIASTSTAYDDQGRVSETVTADGLRIGTLYHENGQVEHTGEIIESPAGPPAARHVVFDEANDLYLVKYSTYAHDVIEGSGAALVRYDAVTDANGNTVRKYKDKLGRVQRVVVMADGSETRTLYGVGDAPVSGVGLPGADDGWEGVTPGGRHVVKIDQQDHATHELYDAAGRLTDVWLPTVRDDDPSSDSHGDDVRPHWHYEYDTSGNQTAQVDPKGRRTEFAYDHHARRISRTLPGTDAAGSFVETWTYDQHGRVTSHTDFEGQVTVHLYDNDVLGRPDKTLHFSSGEVTFANGAPVFDEADAGVVIDAIYDNDASLPADERKKLGRTARVSHREDDDGDGVIEPGETDRTTVWKYDAVTGGLAQVVAAEGTINHEYYEGTGRLKRTWTTNNDSVYEYDDYGRLWKVTTSKLNGQTVNLVTTYTYTDVGSLDVVTLPNGVKYDYDYDALNRLDTLVVRDPQNDKLFEQDFAHEADGRRDFVIEKRYDGVSASPFSTVKVDWTYDDADRLTGEVRDDGNDGGGDAGDYEHTYEYDLNGNRMKKVVDDADDGSVDETITYEYNDRDQLEGENSSLAGNDKTYTYDRNGSMESVNANGSTSRYVWDLRNQLVGVDKNGNGSLADAGDAKLGYDHAGVRVSRAVTGGDTTTYLQDTNNPTGYSQVLEERTNGTLGRSYLLGNDVVAQASGGTTWHLLYDGGGSVRGVTDATGAPATSQIYAYDAFGDRLDPANPVSPVTNLLYRGEYFDDVLGRYHLRARYYDPTTGHFVSLDPFEGGGADPRSLHKYLYAYSDPVNGADPTGLNPLLGTAVHKYLARAFEWYTPAGGAPPMLPPPVPGVLTGTVRRWANREIRTINAGLGLGVLPRIFPLTKRPDFVEVTPATSTGDVYEMKRGLLHMAANPFDFLRDTLLAHVDLHLNIWLLGRIIPSHTWAAGTTYLAGAGGLAGNLTAWPSFRSIWKPVGTTLITYNWYSVEPGVIMYDFIPTKRVAQAVAAAATSLSAAAVLNYLSSTFVPVAVRAVGAYVRGIIANIVNIIMLKMAMRDPT